MVTWQAGARQGVRVAAHGSTARRGRPVVMALITARHGGVLPCLGVIRSGGSTEGAGITPALHECMPAEMHGGRLALQVDSFRAVGAPPGRLRRAFLPRPYRPRSLMPLRLKRRRLTLMSRSPPE